MSWRADKDPSKLPAAAPVRRAAADWRFHQRLAGLVLLFGASFRTLGWHIGDQLVQMISMRLMDRRIGITLEYSFSNISIAKNRLLLGFVRANDLKELFVYAARVDLRFSQSVPARAS
jgi:hypothetical protein